MSSQGDVCPVCAVCALLHGEAGEVAEERRRCLRVALLRLVAEAWKITSSSSQRDEDVGIALCRGSM